MKRKNIFTVIIVCFLLFTFFLGLSSSHQESETHSFDMSSINTSGDSLSTQTYYCDDFEGADYKIYRQMKDFYFVFSSSTYHYGIYLGAMFVDANAENVSLTVYAFVKTLTQYYVANLGASFIFNVTGTYRGVYFQRNGTSSDTAPFMTSDPCLYQFSLFSIEFARDLHLYDLSLSIIYSLTSSEFSEVGSFGCTEMLPAASPADILKQKVILTFIIIGAILGILGIVITSIVIINKRRRRMANGKIPSHWAFSKTRDTGDEGATPTQYVSAPQARPSVEAPEVVSPPPTASRLLEEEREEPVISREPVRTETYSLETVGKLLDDLKYGGRYSRLKVIESLGNSGYTSAVPALVNVLLHDKDPELRAKAAISLGLIGDPDIKPILRRVLNEDSDVNVRNSVADALNIIEGFEDL